MHILVFGASGRTGQEVVRQALTSGHDVSAFVREPSKLAVQHARLRLIQGNVADAASVSAAVEGHDAVVSTLGVSVPLKHDPAVIEGVRNIVGAMQATGVRRLIYQSFVGVTESRAAVGFVLRYVAPIPLRDEIRDHEAKEAIVRGSGTDWTIVRPPKLTNGPASGSYRAGERIRTWTPIPLLSRADVAEFMLRELLERAHIHRAPRLLH